MQTSIRKKNYRMMAMALFGAGIMSICGSNVADAAAIGAEQVERPVAEDQAQQEVERERPKPSEQQAVRADRITVPATSVQIVSSKSLSEKEVRELVPELNKDMINIHTLSRQIQMVNDTGAAKLGANFVSNHDGTFTVQVANEAKDNDKFVISLANNGNEYTGNWRTTFSYLNNNLTGSADNLGFAYITSPDSHFSDVQMAALSYRRLLPQNSASLTFTTSIYDIQQGQTPLISTGGMMGSQSTGKGYNLGMHYQQYLSYTSQNKDMWDFGLDYRQVQTTGDLAVGGVPLGIKQTEDYHILLGSVGFIHNNRDTHHSFTYDFGVTANIGGDDAAYNRNWAGPLFDKYDTNFVYYHAGVNYQVRSNDDWILGAKVHGQYTKDNLVGLAQIGAGGMYTVRGFENCIAGDSGLVGNVEVYTPEIAPGSRFVVFYDYGHLSNNRKGASFSSETLSSVGIGYRYTDKKSGLSVAIDYANPLDDVSSRISNTNNHHRWNAMISMSF
ncbi:ShlB/FhaC/HecB family hemolysin secretion/activation protein [uncultured Anaerovibrio sp.]|nr:ShlB/FhaC/HecB family hemolysin secretion/activation protein [uncultured Anaerovibrio sp.]